MKIPHLSPHERESIRWVKEHSTPEQRMDWLAAAVEFAQAPKVILEERNINLSDPR